MTNSANRYTVVSFDAIPEVPCPCGTSRRALAEVAEFPGTIHRTTISGTAQAHYHRRLTETYYILECDADAAIELNDHRVALTPGVCVVIPPGVIHRAVGHMIILNIVFPKFDPCDEVLVPHEERL